MPLFQRSPGCRLTPPRSFSLHPIRGNQLQRHPPALGGSGQPLTPQGGERYGIRQPQHRQPPRRN